MTFWQNDATGSDYESVEMPTLVMPLAPQVIETRATDPTTGGQKGVKPARYDLIPPEALDVLARVYGWGASKYADRNWERGYPWGWSFAALMRHAWAWAWREDKDPESGLPHMAHVAWHAFALTTYGVRKVGTDDRAA